MKKSTKKNLRIAALLYVILLVVALGVSLAWFISNREVEVKSGDNMVITVGSHLEVDVVGDMSTEGSWGSVVTLNADKVCPDITGDGTHFYFPTTLDRSDQPMLDSLESFLYVNEAEESENYYIEVKLKFRTALPMDVYLAATSNVFGEDEVTPDDLTGSVSSDLIAGAVRIGLSEVITDENGNDVEILKSIWIPNDRYEVTPDYEQGTLNFDRNGTRENFGYLSPDNGVWNDQTTAMVERYWTAQDYASGLVMVGNGQLAQKDATVDSRAIPAMVNGGVPLLTFEGTGSMQEKVLLVRIWVEGTDREANTNLNGGRIKYELDFIGINKSLYTEEEQAAFQKITMGATGLQYENGAAVGSEVLYSFNGIDWISYSASNSDFVANMTANDNTVYIRMAETADKRPGAPRKITK